MNRYVRKLAEIAEKKERRIIGLMSGTSLDGLDIALCRVTNSGTDTEVITELFETVPYDTVFREKLKANCFKTEADIAALTMLNKEIGKAHASIVLDFLKINGIPAADIDLIASHGQTFFHSPPSHTTYETIGAATLQVGDGDQLAVTTGIITVSDFRQKHIAHGGEGAPLAAYGDYLLFSEEQENVVLLNVGGIANYTFLGADGRVATGDIGPGNVLMDRWMQSQLPAANYDASGEVAARGKLSEKLLAELKSHPFFLLPQPKTTGPELFNIEFVHAALHRIQEKLHPDDVMATLNRLTAEIICETLEAVTTEKPFRLYISGGGAHNAFLTSTIMANLKNATRHFCDEKNVNADAKEAVLFALLANECVAGDPAIFEGLSKNMPATGMGKISFPG